MFFFLVVRTGHCSQHVCKIMIPCHELGRLSMLAEVTGKAHTITNGLYTPKFHIVSDPSCAAVDRKQLQRVT